MAKKRNSFIVTEIKDYQKPTDRIEDRKVTEKPKNLKIKTKSKPSKPLEKSKSKPKIETNGNPNGNSNDDLNGYLNGDPNGETMNGNFPPKYKTNRFLQKCFESRREKGMILLSPKVEQKIYKLKKSLRKKGMDEPLIVEIIRKRRREEEIKFNKEASRNCFKCRQSGHFYADCPFNRGDNDGVDICYRCGSSEHKLSECRHKSNGLPFAKCFICQEVGHLTRDCTQNSRGVYPKGGECKACGSINHLIKDCPQNEDQKMENELTLPTFEGIHSIDAEEPTYLENSVDNKTDDKQKIIKF